MITFYPDIKLVHVSTAMISGSVFAVRGLALLLGMRWPRAALVRYLSYTIDTVLLTAAMMLLTVLPAALFANGWLLVKVGFIVAYVALGLLTFRTSARGARQIALYIAALLCFVQVYAIARSHHPAGILNFL